MFLKSISSYWWRDNHFALNIFLCLYVYFHYRQKTLKRSLILLQRKALKHNKLTFTKFNFWKRKMHIQKCMNFIKSLSDNAIFVEMMIESLIISWKPIAAALRIRLAYHNLNTYAGAFHHINCNVLDCWWKTIQLTMSKEVCRRSKNDSSILLRLLL